ncbi:MAG: hypothetical protein HC811_09380 [Flammeovirgaceae bacterium]|nr:hypothetical protein [Flammeovirgaceae bacterium]
MSESDHNIIYMGTGEGFGNLDNVSGNGIFKSTDRGLTWVHLTTTVSFGDINRIIIDPANSDVVVAASNSGLFKSTNGGNLWTQVSTRPLIQDLIARPGNFSIQYAAQSNVGVIKSIDAGATWQLSNTGMSVNGRIEIDISPVNPDRLFASAEGTLSGNDSDLYTSNDAGASWDVVDVTFNSTSVDFLGGQGWYDNTVSCDPFNENRVYFGGVNLFRTELTSGSSPISTYNLVESGTENFIDFVPFASATHGFFSVGPSANSISVEVRFGAGKSQKAHRFLVLPVDATSGVPDASYNYADYITVPFEVWDVTNNLQLMVSFRDQDRNGEFNLLLSNTTGSPTEQSREYLYINNVNYDAANPNTSIATSGGHVFQNMYFFWPVLADGKIWPGDIVDSKFSVISSVTEKLNATTLTSSDAYGSFDSKNRFINYGADMHPDQHNMVMVPMSGSTYKILVANDGGIFVSNTSATPGINQGDWSMRGLTYNTTQFYGADKKPDFDEYIGGTQDNGTWRSPLGVTANPNTNYQNSFGGDGFEVIWHNLEANKIIGGSQGNNFRRSLDGGNTWFVATSGLSGSHPFISKLANSKDNPDVLYTLSSSGVFKSMNFGGTWALTPITNLWGGASSLMDVEVSRANANIVWAGSGMTNSVRNLHVSTDAGISFAPATNYTTVTMGGITKLASHPLQENTAYALFSFSGKPKVLRTTDLGNSWEDISGFGTGSSSTNGFPDVAVYCLYVRPDNPDIIWAGTEIGIVESLDNGVSWTLLDDFPNVSVWDLKAQDDQIVIATHGRGIWTATLEEEQSIVEIPEILDYGTSPGNDLVLRLETENSFDRIEIYSGTTLVKTLMNVSPSEIITTIENISPGLKEIKLIGYIGTAAYHSSIYSVEKLNLLSSVTTYSSYLETPSDFILEGFSIQNLEGSNGRKALQTPHLI